MKKTLIGFFLVCLVLVTLLSVIDFESYFAGKKNSPEETVAPPPANKTEAIIDHADTPEQQVTASPDTPSTVTKNPATTESMKPAPIAEPSVATKIDAEPPPPADKTAQQPVATALPVPADSKSTSNTAEKAPEPTGLLTDTTETSENQLMDPQSRQVSAASSKSAEKTGHGPDQTRPAIETVNLEIAVTPQGTYPYSILLETFDGLATAQQDIASYRKQGIASYWVKANLGKAGVKYRLFAGMFQTVAAAQDFLDKHHLTGKLVKNTSYAAQIGVFRNTKELALAFVKTSKAGVFPYILGTENGPFFLYVGAFYTTDGAESQCRELMVKGFPCKVVTRSTLPPPFDTK